MRLLHPLAHLAAEAVHAFLEGNARQKRYEERRDLARNLTHPPHLPDSQGLPYVLSTYIAAQQQRARNRPH